MSVNDTDTGSAISSPDTQWKAFHFIIQPSLISLLLAHTFMIFLFPLVISLFHFSTPETRRRPVFVFNLAAIFVALVVCIMIDVLQIHTILDPLNQLPLTFSVATGCLGVLQSILADLILLIRIISVYPPRHIGLTRFALLIAPPILLKLARIINIFLFTAAAAKAANDPYAIVMTAIVFEVRPYLKIEWATQMLDNTYVSCVFLWAIRGRGFKRRATGSNVTIAQRMRALFHIALTNFIVPAMFSIAQFVSNYRGISKAGLEQLVLINMMVSTFGVAFATVWAGKTRREEGDTLDSKRGGVTNSSHVVPIFTKYHEATLISPDVSSE